MKKNITKFQKIFGSGPIGLLVSIILLLTAYWLNGQLQLPRISNSELFLNSIFLTTSVITLLIIVWGIKSLPPEERGNKLSTGGAFKYLRHPLYAAFLSMFNFGFAIFLNSYIYILWAFLLHPIWHYLIRYEESLMIELFGSAYTEYQKKTGRFLPKLHSILSRK